MPFVDQPLIVRRLNNHDWKLEAGLTYKGQTDTFEIPTGFVTDFASVPGFLTWLIPNYGSYTLAAILHDWLCTEGISTGAVTSTNADGLFRRVMRELGVSAARRWVMWAGVRWGAIFQAHRRPGSLQTFPLLLAISIAILPLLLISVPPVALALLIFRVVEAISGLWT